MINIDNNEYFELFQFPSKEYGIKYKIGPPRLNLSSQNISLKARLNSGDDILKLLTVVNAIKNSGGAIDELYIPRIPGARQDRIANYGEPLSIEIYANIINGIGAKRVVTLDNHSEVTPALIKNFHIRSVSYLIDNIIRSNNYTNVVIPDGGAAKKMYSYYFPTEKSREGLTFIQCLKNRDTLTGKLSGFKICDEIRPNENYILVDDAIDNGGTAKAIGRLLREKDINKLCGWFTHATLPNGVLPLLYNGDGSKLFNEIHTTNSIQDHHEGVKVYQL